MLRANKQRDGRLKADTIEEIAEEEEIVTRHIIIPMPYLSFPSFQSV